MLQCSAFYVTFWFKRRPEGTVGPQAFSQFSHLAPFEERFGHPSSRAIIRSKYFHLSVFIKWFVAKFCTWFSNGTSFLQPFSVFLISHSICNLSSTCVYDQILAKMTFPSASAVLWKRETVSWVWTSNISPFSYFTQFFFPVIFSMYKWVQHYKCLPEMPAWKSAPQFPYWNILPHFVLLCDRRLVTSSSSLAIKIGHKHFDLICNMVEQHDTQTSFLT